MPPVCPHACLQAIPLMSGTQVYKEVEPAVSPADNPLDHIVSCGNFDILLRDLWAHCSRIFS